LTSLDAAAGEPTDEPAAAGYLPADAVDVGGAALDDEMGLHAVRLSVARLAATQIRPRRGKSLNLILMARPSQRAHRTAL